MNKKIKRKYLINKRFQLGAGFLAVAIQIPCMLATGLGLSWFYLIYLDERTVSSCNSGVLLDMIIVGLVITCIILFLSIRLTHAIVGPIKKTRAVLRQMAQGQPPENAVKFRKNDWFKELALDLNALADRLIKASRARNLALKSLEELKTSLEKDMGQDNGPYIHKIREIQKKL